MTHRTVRDVMTADVVTAAEDAPFKELVEILAERRISAMPVLDAHGRVAGVVSELDLLRKEEYQSDENAKPLPRWRQLKYRAQAEGLTARDLMTACPVCIGPDASIVEAARVLDRHHLRRLMVLDADGRLAGIVTPRDLLKVYLRPDEDIRDEILHGVLADYLGTGRASAGVAVAEGVVTLSGKVATKSMIPLLVMTARSVDGVVDVVNMLGYRIDDIEVPRYPG